MLLVEYKCQLCGYRFEETVIDRQDPTETFFQGSPVHCPNCKSIRIEKMRVKSQVSIPSHQIRRSAI